MAKEQGPYNREEKEYRRKSSINQVGLLGHLGQDPEVHKAEGGRKFVTLSLATANGFKDRDGEYQDQTDWHRIVVFDSGSAERAEKELKKGSKVYVEGRLQTRKWTTDEGEVRQATQVVLQPYKSKLVPILKEKPQR